MPTWVLVEAQQSYEWYSSHLPGHVGGLVKDTLLRDGATTVDAVPMTFRHKDGCAVTVYGDDFSGSRFTAGLGLAEPRHGAQLPRESAGSTFGQAAAKTVASSSAGRWSSLVHSGRQTPGTSRNASRSSVWLVCTLSLMTEVEL